MNDPAYLQLVGGALTLDPEAFQAIASADHGLRISLLTLLLAGASETLGQSVVLILNRVSAGRFALALLLGGAELVAEALLWIASIWLLSGLFEVERPPLQLAVRTVGLAFAPLLLGVLVFFPYIGPAIGRLLRVWVLLAAIVGISVLFGVAPYVAATIAGVGFVGRWGVLRLFSGTWERATAWRWRASTGRSAPLQSSDALLPIGPSDRPR